MTSEHSSSVSVFVAKGLTASFPLSRETCVVISQPSRFIHYFSTRSVQNHLSLCAYVIIRGWGIVKWKFNGSTQSGISEWERKWTPQEIHKTTQKLFTKLNIYFIWQDNSLCIRLNWNENRLSLSKKSSAIIPFRLNRSDWSNRLLRQLDWLVFLDAWTRGA